MLVIYHANCNDGFCAAWLLHRMYENAEFFAAHYGQEPPDVKGKDVIIADFSYKRDILLKMKEEANTLQVYDHHKTAEEELRGLEFCKFDMNKSGARLVADAYGYDSWLVDYTEDRDLWKWELAKSREFNAALSSYPLTFEAWDALHYDFKDEYLREGEAILRYERKMIDHAVKHGTEMKILGHSVLGVNSTVLFSDIAGELAKDRPFGLAWFRRQDGKYQFSLRSGPLGVDVSEIAKHFGGGGHKHAAGFELDGVEVFYGLSRT